MSWRVGYRGRFDVGGPLTGVVTLVEPDESRHVVGNTEFGALDLKYAGFGPGMVAMVDELVSGPATVSFVLPAAVIDAEPLVRWAYIEVELFDAGALVAIARTRVHLTSPVVDPSVLTGERGREERLDAMLVT